MGGGDVAERPDQLAKVADSGSYEPDEPDAGLAALADAAKSAADRACGAIDDALAFIDASNKRIAAMEAKAASARRHKGT